MKLPQEFTDRMRLQLGNNEYQEFESALLDNASISVRLNKKKYPFSLACEKVNWCSDAYFLPERPLFASDPFWHAGVYYVQESSSMLLEQVFLSARKLLPDTSIKVLDLCAAPGGKSTHIASLLEENDILVCNEVIKSRVPVLAENLRKQGYPNTIICSADSSDFEKLGEVFDIIIIDAPCSGEGLFRKDNNAILEWSPENVKTCELRQKRILESAIKCLKKGGILIYSTCTYNPGENEDQIKSLTESGFEAIKFTVNTEQYSSFNCFPHRFRGEGFFIVALQKTTSHTITNTSVSKKLIKPIKAQEEWLKGIQDDLPLYAFENQILIGKEELFRFLDEELSGIYCYAVGTILGSLKEKLFFPSEYLPYSLLLKRGEYPEIEIDAEQALKYFNKNPLPFNGKDKGFVMLHFKDVVVGLGKYAGNRINNLFPTEWKLRNMPAADKLFTIDNFKSQD